MNKDPVTIWTFRENTLVLAFWPTRTTLTIELAQKWYGLWLVTPVDADSRMYRLDELHFGVLKEARGSTEDPYAVDHVPNPAAVLLFCREKGYALDDLGFEMMIGRWETEVKERFS